MENRDIEIHNLKLRIKTLELINKQMSDGWRYEFSMAAMQGLLTDGNLHKDRVSQEAVKQADALLAALEGE